MYLKVFSIIKELFALFEIFLGLRLGLKFFNANPGTPAVEFVYKYSDILVGPFKSIFPDISLMPERTIEISTVVAMLGYWFLIFILLRLLRAFSRD